MTESLVLTALGIVVGFIGTVVGVGGGFIVVPFLTLVYNLSPQLAVGTSMCIVALNAISGTLSYARQHRIDFTTGIWFSLAMFPGAFLGAYILQFIPKQSFEIGFGIFLLCIALYILLKQTNSVAQQSVHPSEFIRPHFNLPLGILISFFVGFYASMAGVGGGLIHVPAMIYLFHYPAYFAIPTSLFILSISSTFAVVSHAMVGDIAWTFVPFLGVGAIIGAQIGGKLSRKVKSKWLIRSLVVLIMVAGVRLISRYF